ncbi:hypothetical protein, partial [Ruminococcus callidus]|uniref:hypothetical protein n=1 Tax=Ruminococcus callidus TaxID=40519 RepID=UPI003FD84475
DEKFDDASVAQSLCGIALNSNSNSIPVLCVFVKWAEVWQKCKLLKIPLDIFGECAKIVPS